MTEQALSVLVVDDDDITAELVERALRRVEGAFEVISAPDGVSALAMMRGRPGGVERPYVVLLDLNMPRMNGFEFLDVLRSDPGLRDSVVFILSTSAADGDLRRAYERYVAGYMVKSRVGPQFAQVSRLDGISGLRSARR